MLINLSQQEIELLNAIRELMARQTERSSTDPIEVDPFDEYSEEDIEMAIQQLACSDDELAGMKA